MSTCIQIQILSLFIINTTMHSTTCSEMLHFYLCEHAFTSWLRGLSAVSTYLGCFVVILRFGLDVTME